MNNIVEDWPKERYEDECDDEAWEAAVAKWRSEKTKSKKSLQGFTEGEWEEEMEKHPMFMSKPLNENEEIDPLVDAFRQLKYDPDMNTADELASSYKDDGNENFRIKKYRWAIDSYTQGINCKCPNYILNVQLYTNRAAAQYHLGNYQKALKDATEAKTLKPDHLKAIQRGIQCCLKLKLFEECLTWCDEGLKIEPKDREFQDSKKIAVREMESAARAERKFAMEKKLQTKERLKMCKILKERGINFKPGSLEFDLTNLAPVTSGYDDLKVKLDSDGCLLWPVLLLYPEYQISDVIKSFHEDSCFTDHLHTMFSEDNTPSWDKESKYKVDVLQVYFTHCDTHRLITVDQDQPIKAILSDNRMMVDGGTPNFFVTVKNSYYDKVLKEKYGVCS